LLELQISWREHAFGPALQYELSINGGHDWLASNKLVVEILRKSPSDTRRMNASML
jgi:hypothetical protein